MGLDTVELIYSFERYFKVEMPDAVAESIYTVGDVVEWLSQQLGVAGRWQSAARLAVAEQLLSEAPPGADETMLLRQLVPDAPALKTCQYALRNRYGLVLPPLTLPRSAIVSTPSLWERLTGQQLLKMPYWSAQTVAELVDWTVAFNYEKLLKTPLSSQYEVAQAVIGITSDKSGVPVEEIRLASSFTDDLEMD